MLVCRLSIHGLGAFFSPLLIVGIAHMFMAHAMSKWAYSAKWPPNTRCATRLPETAKAGDG
jgi:hypothetical protein